MEGCWDLTDLVATGDLARERGISRAAATNWPARYPDFPAPLLCLSAGRVYSRRQVRRWQDERWPGGMAASGKGRRVSPERRAPDPEPRWWDLADLASVGDLARHYEVASSTLCMRMARRDTPDPLLVLSIGPVYSRRQIDEWHSRR